jgi:hypothetical protein
MVYIRIHIKLRTAGHISRMGMSKTPKKISEGTIYSSRTVGMPKTGGIRAMTKRCQKTSRGRQIQKDGHLTVKCGEENEEYDPKLDRHGRRRRRRQQQQ